MATEMEAWPPTEFGIPEETRPSCLSDVLQCLRDCQLNKTGNLPTSATLVPTTDNFSKTPNPPYGILFAQRSDLSRPTSRQLLHELHPHQVTTALRAIYHCEGHWPWTQLMNTACAFYNMRRINECEFQQLSELYNIRTQKLVWVLGEMQKRDRPKVDVERELLSSLVLATIIIDQAVRCIPENERANIGPLLKELDLFIPLQKFRTNTLTLDFEVTGGSRRYGTPYTAFQLYFPAVHKPSLNVQTLESHLEGLQL